MDKNRSMAWTAKNNNKSGHLKQKNCGTEAPAQPGVSDYDGDSPNPRS
jgi:hypothetical protein